MDGAVILLLFAGLAAWLLNRTAKRMRFGLRPKSYVTVAVVVVVGVLILYASAQQ